LEVRTVESQNQQLNRTDRHGFPPRSSTTAEGCSARWS